MVDSGCLLEIGFLMDWMWSMRERAVKGDSKAFGLSGSPALTGEAVGSKGFGRWEDRNSPRDTLDGRCPLGIRQRGTWIFEPGIQEGVLG